MLFYSQPLLMCAAVLLVFAVAIRYGVMALLVKNMIQVEINTILLLSDDFLL